jgi:hypothetical protein
MIGFPPRKKHPSLEKFGFRRPFILEVFIKPAHEPLHVDNFQCWALGDEKPS